ncbi:hypothetical protein BU16DRAFT_556191 [Lophium mytilinum]|uniref:Protein kinase domain-containing protein n=1 Tax=Lophium mytilinum TaxID=390894 RepID=A0A6A6RE27_9PEZI|nr:hypothetical protein BU16DRAFT_556191 [Lophium mytilinum]
MATEDDTIFHDIESQESKDPSPPLVSDKGPIYHSHPTMLELSGHPILTDFGDMRLVEPMSTDWAMPDISRAPEVLLKLPWTDPVDIWSVGVMTLELLEGKNLFDPVDRENHQYVLPLALAQYIGYLGPPSLEMAKRSPLFSQYFDDQVRAQSADLLTDEWLMKPNDIMGLAFPSQEEPEPVS